VPVTRFGLEGYGVRRAGDFSGKTQAPTSGPHPVGVITRFALDGYGARRAGDFSNKTATVVVVAPPEPSHGGFGHRKRKRYLLPDQSLVWATPQEIQEILEQFVQVVDQPKPKTRKQKRKAKADPFVPVEIHFEPIPDFSLETFKPVLPKSMSWTNIKALREKVIVLQRLLEEEEIVMILSHA
jgi:hypothetical protein